MRNICTVWGIVFILLSGGVLYGQIAMKAEVAQNRFLQYEPVYLRLTMRNMSGHPLVFGEHSGLRGALRFEITGTHYYLCNS